ncbi:hypothetical protein [Bacillus pseudomycoides]|uniref:hypothetical protein n=1 Tax=Bacillus pseudomycoides TaxID=64104 RepID=UPI000BF7C310|nr:hypothetical protein [Bacillus pseudomycoides]PGD75914.1 hypothetical protein COM46_13255 [Bacillus pseudomycoides]PHA49388.1 hypothetical protein COE73_13250 [Bacillus pseudomycoides]
MLEFVETKTFDFLVKMMVTVVVYMVMAQVVLSYLNIDFVFMEQFLFVSAWYVLWSRKDFFEVVEEVKQARNKKEE